MGTLKYALDPGGPKRVEVSWTSLWRNVTVSLDGEEIGTVEGKVALQQGRDIALPDGTTLHLLLVQSFAMTELQITRGGKPLPGSASDPVERVRQATHVLWFVGALSALVGLNAVLFEVKLLLELGFGWASVAGGALYGVLGYLTKRGSRVALLVGIAIFVLDGIYGLAMSVGARGSPSVGSFVIRVLLLLPLIRGVGAIGELNAKKGETAAP